MPGTSYVLVALATTPYDVPAVSRRPTMWFAAAHNHPTMLPFLLEAMIVDAFLVAGPVLAHRLIGHPSPTGRQGSLLRVECRRARGRG